MNAAQIDWANQQRINVVGVSGSGKSTLGRRLSRILDLPYTSMDQLYWRPNWQGSTDPQMRQLVEQTTSQRRWLLDGNYSRTQPIKWQRVQLVIWIDLSLPLTLWRVTKRSMRRAYDQQELWPGTGNRETVRRTFASRESVVLWSLTSYHRVKRRYVACMQDPKLAHLTFLRLRSRTAVQRCLDTAEQTSSSPT